jgi:hypothetical protein
VNPAARHLEHNWSKRCFDGEPKPEELTALALSIDHPNDGREHFAVRLKLEPKAGLNRVPRQGVNRAPYRIGLGPFVLG